MSSDNDNHTFTPHDALLEAIEAEIDQHGAAIETSLEVAYTESAQYAETARRAREAWHRISGLVDGFRIARAELRIRRPDDER